MVGVREHISLESLARKHVQTTAELSFAHHSPVTSHYGSSRDHTRATEPLSCWSLDWVKSC